MKTTATLCRDLKKKLNIKIKGDRPISYRLGLNYIRDYDGVLRQQPFQYIEKIMVLYVQMIQTTPMN
jgi:hypothetical protein